MAPPPRPPPRFQCACAGGTIDIKINVKRIMRIIAKNSCRRIVTKTRIALYVVDVVECTEDCEAVNSYTDIIG